MCYFCSKAWKELFICLSITLTGKVRTGRAQSRTHYQITTFALLIVSIVPLL